MTETDELRAMLSERGVEWCEGWNRDITCFDGANDVRYAVDDTLGKMFIRSMLPVTPEQAITATLGSCNCSCNCSNSERTETCHAIDTGCATAVCSVCGAEFMGSIMTNEPPDYVKPLTRCPECGRKIVEVDDG